MNLCRKAEVVAVVGRHRIVFCAIEKCLIRNRVLLSGPNPFRDVHLPPLDVFAGAPSCPSERPSAELIGDNTAGNLRLAAISFVHHYVVLNQPVTSDAVHLKVVNMIAELRAIGLIVPPAVAGDQGRKYYLAGMRGFERHRLSGSVVAKVEDPPPTKEVSVPEE